MHNHFHLFTVFSLDVFQVAPHFPSLSSPTYVPVLQVASLRRSPLPTASLSMFPRSCVQFFVVLLRRLPKVISTEEKNQENDNELNGERKNLLRFLCDGLQRTFRLFTIFPSAVMNVYLYNVIALAFQIINLHMLWWLQQTSRTNLRQTRTHTHAKHSGNYIQKSISATMVSMHFCVIYRRMFMMNTFARHFALIQKIVVVVARHWKWVCVLERTLAGTLTHKCERLIVMANSWPQA